MTNPLTEPLEPRRLLAGVTILMHGYNGNIDGWVKTAAEDIADRAGGTDHASIYTMTVTNSGGPTVTGFAPDSGQKDFRDTLSGELIVRLDWSSVSGGAYSTKTVGEAISNYLLTAHGNVAPLVELPIHLIGHSRGASLAVAISEDLGERGVWVDQLTSLDPVPVNGVNNFAGLNFGDHDMEVYDNVVFADNYWRTDGNVNNFDFDGEPVDGAYEGDLNQIVQTNFFVSAHGAVPAYYIGTIDTDTSDGGDHPVLGAWYGSGKPERDQTGFVFARLGDATRPAGGFSTLLGGSGTRESTDVGGSQYPNALLPFFLNDSTVSAGEVFQLTFKGIDRDSSARYDVFIDADRNPYDGASLLTGKTETTNSLQTVNISVPSAGLREGTYNLAIRSTSGGLTRWSYLDERITVTAPNFATLENGTLTVNGTAGNDVMTVYRIGNNIVTTLNGVAQSFAAVSVTSTLVYGLEGKDSIDCSAMVDSVYVLGGPNEDNIVGGAGNDTLSGASHSDTIRGWTGDDLIQGFNGNDLLVGNGGNDRIYGGPGDDSINGGSNVDRIWGNEGNDYLIGGTSNDKIYAGPGDDTLLGEAGSDILDGMEDTDTADNDPDDFRYNIEILL